jgi:arginine-tRNA-protein transferase
MVKHQPGPSNTAATAGALAKGQLVQLFATPPEPCPYLPDRLERKLLTPLTGPDAPSVFDELLVRGFRRSHTVAYRPACRGCDACLPVRVRVADFTPSRSMRKIASLCAEWLTQETTPALARPAHYRVFQRYQSSRHGGGEMERMSFGEYRAMVEESYVRTTLVEFRADSGIGKPVGVMIYDRAADGLSGLYQFFEPEIGRKSPGTYMILWLIERARAFGLPYVYLGYYIAESRKMAYKARFRPLEILRPTGRWMPFET